MRLAIAGHPHLTYNTAIHGGETWPEVRRALTEQVLPVTWRHRSTLAVMASGCAAVLLAFAAACTLLLRVVALCQ